MSNISNQSLDEFGDLKESNSEADFSINDDRKAKRKDSKRLFTKKESKDKGYSTLDADNSQESIFLMTKSSKKPKQDVKIGLFKKNSTKEEKKEKKDANTESSSKRIKVEKRKKVKDAEVASQNIEKILFGESLENTIAAYPCNDGLNIPYPIRMCFDVIEEKGLECEGIYRRIRNKSQIDGIFEAINNTNFESKLNEINADPLIAGSIVKKFFRDLKAPLISDDQLNLFEKCEQISDKDVDVKIEAIKKTLKKLPTANRETLSFLIVHLSKVMQKSEVNKMDSQNIILTFQTIVRIKDRLFKFILKNSSLIFKDFRYRKYRNKPADDTIARLSLLPDSVQELENEIANQEKILSELHSKIAKNEKDKKAQEQLNEELWAIQRYVTSLKRKVKKLKMDQKSSLDIQMQEITNSVVKNSASIIASSATLTSIDNSGGGGKLMQNSEAKLKYLENTEIVRKDELIKTISENEVLVETLQALFEKLSKEKVKIFDLQQQYKTFPVPLSHTSDTIVTNYESINIGDLQASLDQLLNENKQIEDRISLVNEKITLEKRKIFKLKSDIKYHDCNYYINSPVAMTSVASPTSSILRLTSPVLSNTSAMSPTNIVIIDNGTTTKL